MKKTLLITLASSALAASGFAQGSISFQATAANGLVSYSLDNATVAGTAPTAGVPGYGIAHVGFFAAPDGTVLALGSDGRPNFTTAWTFASTIENIAIGAGKTAAAAISLPSAAGAPGQNVELEIVGWTGSATSWAAAIAEGSDLYGFSGMTLGNTTYGKLGWSQTTGNPTTTPAGTPSATLVGAGGYNGLVLTSTPEPTTIVLGGLGAAALLALRRRK